MLVNSEPTDSEEIDKHVEIRLVRDACLTPTDSCVSATHFVTVITQCHALRRQLCSSSVVLCFYFLCNYMLHFDGYAYTFGVYLLTYLLYND